MSLVLTLVMTWLLAMGGTAALAASSPSIDFAAWGASTVSRSATLYPDADYSRNYSLGLGAKTGAQFGTPVDVTVSVDLSHLASTVTISDYSSQCTRSTAHLTCAFQMTGPGDANAALTYHLGSGIRPGPAGYIAYSVNSANDPNSANNTGRVTLNVVASSLGMKIALSPHATRVPVGSVSAVTVTVHNYGPNPDSGLTLFDFSVDLPTNAAVIVGASGCTHSRQGYSCMIHDLLVGTSRSVHLSVKVLTCGDRRHSPPTITIGYAIQNEQLSPTYTGQRAITISPSGCDSGAPGGGTAAGGTSGGPSGIADGSSGPASHGSAAPPAAGQALTSPAATQPSTAVPPTVSAASAAATGAAFIEQPKASPSSTHGGYATQLGFASAAAAFIVLICGYTLLRRRRSRVPADDYAEPDA